MPVYTPIRTPRRVAATIPPSAEPSILKPVGGSVMVCQASPFNEATAILLDQEQEMSMPAGVTWTFTAQWLQGVEMTRRDDTSGAGSVFTGALSFQRAADAIPNGWQAVSEFSAGGVTLRVLQRIPPVIEEPPVVVPVMRRAPSTIGFHHVHSGHSLTDSYSHGGIEGWPGDSTNLFNGNFGAENFTYERTHVKDTIPGSPIRWRWENAQDGLAIGGISNFDVLMITEGGPPPRPTPTDKTAANDTLDYLMRFVQNAQNNGRADGAETIVWSIWPNVEGWIGAGGSNETIWAPFGGFRGCLAEYGRVFRFYAEYATWKMKRLRDDLPANYRVWMFPGHAWMARVYDDAEAGLVPGITSYRDLFRDDIHPNAIGEYGLAVFVHTMLYQRDQRIAPAYAPATTVLSAELDTYFKRIAWEIANSEESAGMGGTANATPSFDPAVYGDPLDPTYVHGEDGETPPATGPQPPADSIIRWNAAGYNGPALTGPQPTVMGDVLRFAPTEALTFALNQPMTGFYTCIRGRLTSPGTQFIMTLVGLTNFLTGYSSTSMLDMNGYTSQFYSAHKPEQNQDTWSEAGSGVQSFATEMTIESWVINGNVITAVNGVEVTSRPILAGQTIPTTSNVLLMSASALGLTYDMNGMVLMDREPNETERANIRAWVQAEPTGVVVPDPEPEPGVAGPTFTALANTAPVGFAGHSALMEILDGGNFGTHWPGPHHATSPADGYHSQDHWEANGAARNNPISAMVISEMDEAPDGRYAAPGTAQAAVNLQHQYWFGRMAADQNASLVLLWHTTPRASYATSWEHNRSVINFYRQWLTGKLGREVFVLPVDLYISKLRETMTDDQIWQDGVHLLPAVRPGLGYMLARMLSGVVPTVAPGEEFLHQIAMETLAEYRWGGTGGTGNDDIYVAADPLPNPLPIGGTVEPDPEPVEPTDVATMAGLLWYSEEPIAMDGVNVQTYALTTPGTVGGPVHVVLNMNPSASQTKTGNNVFQVIDANNAAHLALVYNQSLNTVVCDNDFSGSNHMFVPIPAENLGSDFVMDMSVSEARTPTARMTSPLRDNTTELPLPDTNVTAIRFGTPNWGGEVLTGEIYRIAVFNRILSETERAFVLDWATRPAPDAQAM